MQNTMKISDRITVGPQPEAKDFAELKRQGFRSVVNLRTSGEEEQPLSPQEEREEVQQQGMEYEHIPVSIEDMQVTLVDKFRLSLSELPGPVYVHCKTGKRAGAFSVMHHAVEQGVSGEEAVHKAMEMGFECDKPALVEFVKDYIDSHHASAKG